MTLGAEGAGEAVSGRDVAGAAFATGTEFNIAGCPAPVWASPPVHFSAPGPERARLPAPGWGPRRGLLERSEPVRRRKWIERPAAWERYVVAQRTPSVQLMSLAVEVRQHVGLEQRRPLRRAPATFARRFTCPGTRVNVTHSDQPLFGFCKC